MMASQNDKKAPTLSMVSAQSCSFSAPVSAETIVLLGTVGTCFKHD